MPRLQFSIRTLLWLTLVVAAFLAGMRCERESLKRQGYARFEYVAGDAELIPLK
jgi:hypothetical protein